jgi:hypothetical protein
MRRTRDDSADRSRTYLLQLEALAVEILVDAIVKEAAP